MDIERVLNHLIPFNVTHPRTHATDRIDTHNTHTHIRSITHTLAHNCLRSSANNLRVIIDVNTRAEHGNDLIINGRQRELITYLMSFNFQ